MAATNRYMNVGATTFTPAGGSAIPITGIKSVSYDEGVSVKKESADTDLFMTVSVTDHLEPVITIETIDAMALMISVPAATKGTLLVTILDAYNKVATSGGGKTFTMTLCQVESRGTQHRHREYGTQTLRFGAVSADGSTHPVTVSAL